MSKLTPMLRQYRDIKDDYPDAFLFFRLGDFYEMFFDDALEAAKILEIVLTARSGGQGLKVPMCGVPYHSANSYIRKLIDRGHKVAICEQVEDPKTAKGIVKRSVVRIITPGTVLEDEALVGAENNYIACLSKDQDHWAIAYADMTTGSFYACQHSRLAARGFVQDELGRISPAELLLDTSKLEEKDQAWIKDLGYYISEEKGPLEAAYLDQVRALSREKKSLFDQVSAQKAAARLLSYLEKTQKRSLGNISAIDYYQVDQALQMDVHTRRNLEISRSIRRGDQATSLVSVVDKTRTSAGGRKLRRWLMRPLLSVEAIEKRQEYVAALVRDPLLARSLRTLLDGIYDLERIMTRVAYERAHGRDLESLKKTLAAAADLKAQLAKSGGLFASLALDMDVLTDLTDLLDRALSEEPPRTIKEGGIIGPGYNKEVDDLRQLQRKRTEVLAQLASRERESTGIKNLKIAYNRVFGYYIEVTKSQLSRVPERYQRKQTLANAERFITQELKELEETILGAKDKLFALEYALFIELRETVNHRIEEVQILADQLAALDVYQSFARQAAENNYVRPQFSDQIELELVAGRHPVVEALLEAEPFVPNDGSLSPQARLAILTGPNMAGKSTYIRMMAILTILAQAGSFVPAKSFRLGLVDRIFARVGASDDLARGDSTFMVEMKEVANILNHATDRSLIILDEVGRGTSTVDGLSIAWAISEYILEKIRARTFFASHYHELISLEDHYQGVVNLSMAVKEEKDRVIFLRTVVKKGTDNSYGIHVAQMAGLPASLIQRAKEKLDESRSGDKALYYPPKTQLTLAKDHPLSSILEEVSPADLSPRQALDLVYLLKEESEKL